ncbi:MAG: polyprenyl synthetase family protein [Myxococcota bacterium]
MSDLHTWMADRRAALDHFLQTLFDDAWPGPFREPLRYPVFGGGKRVRPILCLAAFEAVTEPGTAFDAALPAAAALELVHTYSLVHDDLPAMDDDDERRGRPTVHIAFDQPTAILVGDALLTEAFGILARAPLTAEVRIGLVSRLSAASGYLGMIGGQAADVGIGGPVTDLERLTELHAGKTGALLQASAAMGGMVAEARPADQANLETYGRAVGLAFQLADDVLDAEEDAGEEGPPSFVKLLGVEETERRARALAAEAIEAAEQLPRGAELVRLARYIVERDV